MVEQVTMGQIGSPGQRDNITEAQKAQYDTIIEDDTTHLSRLKGI